MKDIYKSVNYKFSISGIRFSVEVEQSHTPHKPGVMVHYPMHTAYFVFDEGMTLTTEKEAKHYVRSVVCIPPFMRHNAEFDSKFRLLFSFSIPEKDTSPFASFLKNKLSTNDVYATKSNKEAMRAYLEELFYILEKRQNELGEELQRSLLKLIFYYIYLYSVYDGNSPTHPSESYYLTVNRLISQNVSEGLPVTLDTVATALHLSKKQASRIISKYYSKPLSEVVTEARIDYSAYLLTTTEMSVSEIAHHTGFRTENYFYTKFKSKMNTTPLAYRKEHTKALK